MLKQYHPFSGLFKIWICPRSQLEFVPHLFCSNLDVYTIIGAYLRLFCKICVYQPGPGLMLDHTGPVFPSQTDGHSHSTLSSGVSYSLSQFCSCIYYSFKKISQDPQAFCGYSYLSHNLRMTLIYIRNWNSELEVVTLRLLPSNPLRRWGCGPPCTRAVRSLVLCY